MTTDFAQQYNSVGVNLYGSAIATSAQEQYEPESWTDITNRCKAAGMDIIQQARVLELRVTDPRPGWGQVDDRIKTATSTAYQVYRRHLLLPPKITQTTLGTAGPDNGCLFHCWFGTEKKLVMGGGTETNFQLFQETSATDPTPTGVTVSLTGSGALNVVSISAGVLNNTDERAIVGQAGGGVGQYMAANLGSKTDMHANTADLWGSGRTNINASTPGLGGNILYAGGSGGGTASIYYMAESSAIAGAPTQTLQGIPAGGAVVGVEALQKNWLNRIYMWWPLATQTASAIQLGYPGYFVSLNLEGTGPELVPTTLSRTYFGFLSNRTLVMSDGVRMVSYDGETERDLHVLKGRESNSDYRWGVSGGFDHEGVIYAFVVRFDLTVGAGTVGASVLTLERYYPEMDAWVPVTGTWDTSSAGGDSARETIYGRVDFLHNVGMSMPYSKQTGFVHMNMRSSTKWDRTWLAPEGVNPFYHYNKTGTNDEISQQWAASATYTSDAFPIRGYHGLPAVLAGFSATEMDIAAGGTSAKVNMSWANQSGTGHNFTNALNWDFLAADPISQQKKWFLNNSAYFTQCKYRLTLTQGTDDNKTVNALPALFYVIVYLDGVVRTPAQAGFTGW